MPGVVQGLTPGLQTRVEGLWCACCCPKPALYNKDMAALMYNGPGRLLQLTTFLFLSYALLYYAELEAGCLDDDAVDMAYNRTLSLTPTAAPSMIPTVEQEPLCEERVYGMRPSSIVPNISVFNGVVITLTIPFVGAMVDYSPWRRSLGYYSAAVLVFTNFLQIFVSAETWFLICIVQVPCFMAYYSHLLCVYAYIPELTDDEDEMAAVMGPAKAIETISTLIFFGLIAVSGATICPSSEEDFYGKAVCEARVAQTLSCIVGVGFFYQSWKLFSERPAVQSLPGGETVEGKSLTKASSMLCGQAFRQIWGTLCELQTDFPMTARFLIAYAFWESASNAILTLSTTYIRLVLKIDSIVVIGAILLVTNIIGALLTGKFGPKLGMRRVIMGCLLADCLVCVLLMSMLRGPDDQMWAYVLMLPLGLVMGSMYTAQRAHYAVFIPGGREAELMGFYMFAGQVISWAPMLVFSVINEATNDMSLAFPILVVFYIIAAVIFSTVDHQKNHECIEPTLNRRVRASRRYAGGGASDGAAGGGIG